MTIRVIYKHDSLLYFLRIYFVCMYVICDYIINICVNVYHVTLKRYYFIVITQQYLTITALVLTGFKRLKSLCAM